MYSIKPRFNRRRLFSTLVVYLFAVFGFCVESAWAVPSLQLDIYGGFYDSTTQTIKSSGNTFTLYAYLIPDKNASLTDTYYISAAIVPQISSSANLGSFVFASQQVLVTQNMVYGVPPIESNLAFDPHDLSQHGVFPTYFTQFSFLFDPKNTATAYDTSTNTGAGPTFNPNGTMYYAAFNVDTSLLDPNYEIHFDLYNTITHTTTTQNCFSTGTRNGKNKGTFTCTSTTTADVDINSFAPFSHDAQSDPVPEPGSLLLLGIGLFGCLIARQRLVK